MVYRLKDCELDAARFELRREGRQVPVEPQVLELLLYLVAHRDRAVTRAELFDKLWRGRIVTDAALNSRIKAARSAIGDDGAAQAQIRTLHRTGYRFVGDVDELLATEVNASPHTPATAAVAVAAQSANAPRSPASFAWRPLRFAGAVLGLVLAVGTFSLLPHRVRDIGDSAAVASSVPPRATPSKSLAVLPFTNLSADAAQEYFAEGVSTELLIVLSHLPDLHVSGRVSSLNFKGRTDPLPKIAETLGVANLLTGSVRRAEDRVRITVELVDAASGYQLWSDSYDRELGDIFDVQDDIAANVATALQVTLGLGESGEIGMTRNVAAYDEFLRGTALYNERTAESIPRAVEHMHRALALDPGFSRAWSYLYCIQLDGSSVVPGRAEEYTRKAVEALEHARGLTPDAPFVRILSARDTIRRGDRLAAGAALDALPAGYWTADRYLTRDIFRGRTLIDAGFGKEAVDVLERARAADPLSPPAAMYLALAYAISGDSANAFATIDRGVELGFLVPILAGNAMLVALGTGDEDEIRRRVAALQPDAAGNKAIHDALVAHLGDPTAARAELRRIAATPAPPDYVRSAVIAHWAAYFGDTELALGELRNIAHAGLDEAALWRPVLSEVRKLPGFKDLVRSEGLVDYWRAYGWPDVCRPTAGEDFECT
jgi:TolB-like protein/DNA-binding winged helix-turn-helix (wHTH) protein/Flp pilus assembly protein TadD